MEIKNIEHFIQKHNMIREHDKIIIGVSGGSDSICLLFVLKKLSEKINLSLKVVHINHGLRDTAKRDEDFVRNICEEIGIPCLIYKEKVKEFAKTRKMSIEEAGREIRRMRFQEVLLNIKGTKIALGHHLDDNAETLLMNLARGTGLKGMTGIKPIWGNYIRPLLCLTKKEVEELLKSNDIPYQQDETNKNIDFTRNRIREVTIPSLVDINSNAVNNINNTIAHLAEVEKFVAEDVRRTFDKCITIINGTRMNLSDLDNPDVSELALDNKCGLIKDELSNYPVLMQRFVVKKTLEKIAPQEKNISAVHVDSVIELFNKQVGRKLDLPYRLVARREYEGIRICKFNVRKKKTKIYTLNIPGITLIPEMKLKVDCTIMEVATQIPSFKQKKEGHFHIKGCDYQEDSLDGAPYLIYTKSMDYDIIKGGLSVRTREPGDFIVIDKLGHRQKIKSYFINEKIPSHIRETIPLVADGSEIVWILGYRKSCGYQVTKGTKRILEMKIVEDC